MTEYLSSEGRDYPLNSHSIQKSIAMRLEDKYAFMENFVQTLSTNRAKISGDKKFWNSLMEIKEVKETSMRFKDLNALVDDFIKRWNTDYIMFIMPASQDKGDGEMEMTIRVIQIKNREVVFLSY